jgi:hypothetical protein
MRARPTRPLPSAKGWMVSNCAWAMAAWTTGARSVRFMNATRSPMRSFTRSGAGGTKSARPGLNALPPIQFWRSRSLPAISGVVVVSIRRRWTSRTSFSRSGFAAAPRATACSIAVTLPRMDRAVSSRGRALRPRRARGGAGRGPGPRSGRTRSIRRGAAGGRGPRGWRREEDRGSGHRRRARRSRPRQPRSTGARVRSARSGPGRRRDS